MNDEKAIIDILTPYGGHIHIVETGCSDTVEIAKWVASEAPEADFSSVDLDSRLQEVTHKRLEELGCAAYCTFHTQDAKKYLSAQSWIDIAFLKPSDLQSGLEEFCFAVSAGAKLIAMRDYQTRAALASLKAKSIGWQVTFQEPFSVLKRQWI